MKKEIFLTTLIAAFCTLPACAEITPAEATSVEYLKNHGHSQAIVEMVQISKATAHGEEYITEDEAKHANDSTPVRWIRRIFTYFDPALDDGKFLRHDTKNTPSIDDL